MHFIVNVYHDMQRRYFQTFRHTNNGNPDIIYILPTNTEQQSREDKIRRQTTYNKQTDKQSESESSQLIKQTKNNKQS
jgi:hypothetical protein